MNDPPERERNVFGTTVGDSAHRERGMEHVERYVAETDAPTDRPHETLEAGDLPPPQPLKETLERLAELDDDSVLVQFNDRAPQHLYPKLADRGYEYETVEADDAVVTVVWTP